jgi:hypothetical protein
LIEVKLKMFNRFIIQRIVVLLSRISQIKMIKMINLFYRLICGKINVYTNDSSISSLLIIAPAKEPEETAIAKDLA